MTSNVIGMMWAHLERQSTTTMMASYPWLCGSSMMRSTEMICQQWSGTLLGISHPVRGVGRSLCSYTGHSLSHTPLHSSPYLATRSCVLPGPSSSISRSDPLLGSHGGQPLCHVPVDHPGGHRLYLDRVPGHPFLTIPHDISPCQCSA